MAKNLKAIKVSVTYPSGHSLLVRQGYMNLCVIAMRHSIKSYIWALDNPPTFNYFWLGQG